ncbi:MAG TPA: hypothetical protein VJ654_12980 [Noviherbaspirillum sp.]|nr:hypothetical protein [Noviherbaspirillum sp.]
MTNKVTQEDLKAALGAWNEAREKAAQEHAAWGRLLQSHGALIRSMVENGWTFAKAKQDVDGFSNAHNEKLLAALGDMDEKYRLYQDLEAAYNEQNSELQKMARKYP